MITFLVEKDLLPPDRAQMLRGWVHSGFHVHRSRRVLQDEREDLERLAQYIIRNPFSVEKTCTQDTFLTHYRHEGAHLCRSRQAAATSWQKQCLINLKTECGFEIHRPGTGVEQVRAAVQYGFHSCRHTFVSICRKNGVPDAVIKAIVGGSYELYTHIDRDSTQRAIDRFPSLLKKKPVADDQAAAEPVTSTSLDGLTNAELLDLMKGAENLLEKRRKTAAA